MDDGEVEDLLSRSDQSHKEGQLASFDRAAVMPEVRRLSRVNGWHTTFLILANWGVVALAAWGAVTLGHWWAYLIAAIIIGTRQQAMGVMVHDASHYLLYKNHVVNDVVSDLFLGFPIGLSTTLYRHTHFLHHRFTSTDRDPDWVMQQNDPDWTWPKTWRETWTMGFLSILGLNIFKMAKVYMQWSPSSNLFKPHSPAYPLRARILLVVSTIIVYVALFLTKAWIPAILLWLLPALTMFNLLNRLRAISEHLAIPHEHELNQTRTVIPTWWERLLIAPAGINYHLEHHMFPSVPGYRLGILHRSLMQRRDFQRHAHVVHGYFNPKHGVLAELVGRKVVAANDPVVVNEVVAVNEVGAVNEVVAVKTPHDSRLADEPPISATP